ncbi:MAG: insulinase family protein [Proteobacteria bacterium]|nr:insulinase family protein [Pseudomonadota bacterium]MCP4919935.1 insulinase family protein [Pseudomonadota bacterium]
MSPGLKRAWVLGLMGLGLAAAPERTIPEPIPLTAPPTPDIEKHTLSSGAPVWLLARHEVPLVRIELSVTWPGADATTEEQLLSSLAGLLVETSGTQQRDSGAWSSELEKLGASTSIGVSSRRLWADVEAPTGSEDEALELVAEALFQPAFDAKTARPHIARWAAERRDLALEIHRIHQRGLNHAWFPVDHPLRQTSQTEDIEALSAEAAQALLERILATGQVALVVVGDTSADRVLPLLESTYGHLEGEEAARPVTPVEPPPTRWLVDRPGFDIAQVTVAVPAPPVGHDDVPALQVWMTALAGTFTSRLNADLREERGLTYGVQGSVGNWYGAGRAEVDCVSSVEHVGEVLLGIEDHLDRVETHGITQAELDTARNHILLSEGRAFASLAYAAAELGELLTIGNDLAMIDAGRVRLMELTPADVALAARKWASPAHRVWVVTGPREPLEIQLEQADRIPDRIVDAEVLGTEP